jgi:hydroxymethylbilane synthase
LRRHSYSILPRCFIFGIATWITVIMSPPLKIGTRSSPLARWQADWVAARLVELGQAVEIVFITTQGDVRSGPLGQIGGQGLFTKEIQRALLSGEVDIAVHSLKDLPTQEVDGLTLGAIPPRESAGDVLVARQAADLASLPTAARVGTGSLRRRTQLLHARPDLVLLDIRGNVDTRLRKLDDGEFDAIVLAEAGLKRLGLESRITAVLPKSIVLPAVGQGALGIEIRANDVRARDALAPLDDVDTRASVVAERALLAELRGGCLAPVGAWGRVEEGELRLDAVVLSADGKTRIAARETAEPFQAHALGVRVAAELLRQGADALIAESRRSPEPFE